MKKYCLWLSLLIKPVFLNPYYKNKQLVDDVKKKIKNKPIVLLTPQLPNQSIEILEYGDHYVIVKSSAFLGFKHCFYKAIEFFNSKYASFLLKMASEIRRDGNFIIVKFIAYNIKEE
jgi:hypothetical protein